MGETQVKVMITGEATGVLGVLGQVQTKIQELGKTSQSSGATVKASFDGQAQAVAKVDSGLKGLVATLASIRGLGGLAESLKESALQAERLQNSLRYATGNAITAADTHNWLKKVVEDLGLEMASASRGFMTLAAAARGTSMEGEGVQRIFRAVASATTALGLSADQAEGAMLAIGQMMSKGRVQAEELRGQLGERLPGAFGLAAQAMGVTTGQLDDMLKKGEVVASDFLPKFADKLQQAFGADAAAAASGTQASLNRLSSAWTDLQQTVAKSGVTQAAGAAVDSLTKALRGAVSDGSAASLGQALGGMVRNLSSFTQAMWEHKEALVVVLGLWAAWRVGPAVAAGVQAISTLTASIVRMGTTKTVVDALTGATSTMTTGFSLASAASGVLTKTIAALGGPVGAIVALVGALVVGITAWALASKDSTGQVLKDADERIKSLREEIRLYKERQRQATGKTFEEKASDVVLSDLKKLEQEYGNTQVRIQRLQEKIARGAGMSAEAKTGVNPVEMQIRQEEAALKTLVAKYRELTGLELERQGIAADEKKRQEALAAAIKAAEDAAKNAGKGKAGNEDEAYRAMEQTVAREAQLRKQRQSDWEKHQADMFEIYGSELDREERKLNEHYDQVLRRAREFGAEQADLEAIELQREEALQQARTDAARRATDERLRIAREEAEERQKYLEQFGTAQEGWQAGLQEFLQRSGTTFTTMRAMAVQSMQGLQSAFAKGVQGMLTGQMTLSQGLKAIWQGILGVVANFISQLIARWIAMAIANRLVKKQEAEAENSKAVASQHAAAAGIFQAHSGIPYVGPIIAAAFVAMMGVTLGANLAAAKGMAATARKVGGLVDGPELTLLGEAGPELVAPERDFKDWARTFMHAEAGLAASLAATSAIEQRYALQAGGFARAVPGPASGSSSEDRGGQVTNDFRGAMIFGESMESSRQVGEMLRKAELYRQRTTA